MPRRNFLNPIPKHLKAQIKQRNLSGVTAMTCSNFGIKIWATGTQIKQP